ncbi:MAG: hypothetical protein JXC31_03555 [Acholeplasmataceae bacterium]|nr:hypothetical protein [Acholeplasmataceae bacterium]
MYKQLTKLLLKQNFSLKRLLGFDIKKSKIKGILIGLAIIYAVVAFFGAFGFLFFNLGEFLNDLGQTELLLSFLTVYSIGISIIIVLLRASGYLFYYKDYDILAPLPIHSRTILLSKLSVMLIMLYFSSLIFTLPIAFSYFYWSGFNIIGFVFYFIGFIFLPLIPVIVMSFISLLIAMATASFRHNKLLSIIILFAATIGLLVGSFSVNEVDVNPLTGQINLFSGISNAYPPFEWFIQAVHQQSIGNLLLLVGTHGLALFLFIILLQGLVQKTNQKGVRSNIRKNNKTIKYQEKPVIQTLIQKEFKKYFSSILYAVNSGIGPVMMIVLSVASLFYRSQIETILVQMSGVNMDIEILVLAFISFCISMTYTPAISLSLEGKNFWIIKSLPIKAETVVFSKIAFNLVLCVPIAIVSILMFGVSIGFSAISQLILIALAIVFAVLISTFNAIVNLYVPKFDYVNEQEVVKQSAGALLGIFGGFTLIAINGIFYYFMMDVASFTIITSLMILLNLVMATPLVYFVKTKASVLFSKMKA